jgi:hypothetical protein
MASRNTSPPQSTFEPEKTASSNFKIPIEDACPPEELFRSNYGVNKSNRKSEMSWFAVRDQSRRPIRPRSLLWNVEMLEDRALLADGITPLGAPSIHAFVGVPVTNATFATYSVSDPSGEPGDQWRAHISFGDGLDDGPVIPVQRGAEFEFIDSHTYNTPGTYTVTVMIAEPGSHAPNDNVVKTQVIVTTGAPIPTPTPPPPQSQFKASGLRIQARTGQQFKGSVALFSDPHTQAQEFGAFIDWGDGSTSSPGRVHTRGSGRFAVSGSHRYIKRGIYQVTVTIQDTAGREASAVGSARILGK